MPGDSLPREIRERLELEQLFQETAEILAERRRQEGLKGNTLEGLPTWEELQAKADRLTAEDLAGISGPEHEDNHESEQP